MPSPPPSTGGGAPPAWCGDALRVTFMQAAQKVAAPGQRQARGAAPDPVSMLTEFLLRPSRKAWAESGALASPWRSAAARCDKEDRCDGVPALLRGRVRRDRRNRRSGASHRGDAGRHGARSWSSRPELRTLHDVRAWIAVDDRDDVDG